MTATLDAGRDEALPGIDDGFGIALARLGASVARRPWRALPAAFQFTTDMAAAGTRTVAAALGRPGPGVVDAPPRDRRFADPAWQQNPWFYGAGQAYLAWARFVRDVAATSELPAGVAQKAAFAVDAVLDAVAPTNFLPGNPAALRRAIETRGESLRAGLDNFLRDVADNRGRPAQVDRSAFTLGENLAATPGKVVFRNDLMELIQYAPQTETVYETPLLLSPPWINKYYIMDLAPGRSFAEWAVQHGHTVFAISYRNPDESMRDVALDDYLVNGPCAALDVARDITGAAQLNIAGLCVGGTLAVALLAHLAATTKSRSPVRSLTLLNTLVDFSQPGPLGAFTDAAAVESLERRMAERGYLDGAAMAKTFDFLRANDLIWNYVASGWLMGEPAPAFDILAWNSDPMNVTEATHSGYLRACYLENRLARSELTLAGRRVDLDAIDVDTEAYILAAKEDHITPWKSSYATTGLLPTPTRFVLTSSGHIAGVVNPPSPKRHYWTNHDLPEDPEAWLTAATRHQGSWWEDWTQWIARRAGTRVAPPPLGNATHPPLTPAPGTYVRSEP